MSDAVGLLSGAKKMWAPAATSVKSALPLMALPSTSTTSTLEAIASNAVSAGSDSLLFVKLTNCKTGSQPNVRKSDSVPSVTFHDSSVDAEEVPITRLLTLRSTTVCNGAASSTTAVAVPSAPRTTNGQ